MVYVVDTRILQFLVKTGLWHLVGSEHARKMDIKTVEIRDKDPSPVDAASEWVKHQGRAILVVADDGVRLFKCQPLGQNSLKWRQLKPSYRLLTVSTAMLDRAMALRLVQNDVDQGARLASQMAKIQLHFPIHIFCIW